MKKRAENIISIVENIIKDKFEENVRTKLITYYSFLLETNQTINLISRKSEDMVLENGLVESYFFYKQLQKFTNDKVEDLKFCEIGSGGGIPGIIIAILCPQSSFTLIDSIGKKTRFLENAAEKLDSDNIFVINGRLEALSKENNKKFDITFSRGVGHFDNLLTHYFQIIKKDGAIFFLTGINNIDEKLFKRSQIIKNPYFDNRIITIFKK